MGGCSAGGKTCRQKLVQRSNRSGHNISSIKKLKLLDGSKTKAVSSKMTCLEIMIVRGGEGSGILYDKRTNPKRRIGRIEARVCGRLWQTGWCNTCSQKCEGDHTPEVCPREQGAAWRTLGSWSEMLTRRSS